MKYVFFKIIFLVLSIFTVKSVNAGITNDTIPPSFTRLPQDITVSCEQNLFNRFSNWYNNSANAQADNGEAEVLAILDLDVAFSQMEESLTECNQTGSYSLGFFAQDTCGNVSTDTLTAQFIVADRVRPLIMQSPTSVSLYCTESTPDSLSQWVQNSAGTIAFDNCDDDPQWINYVWMDSEGDSGFGDYNDSIDLASLRSSCIWSIEFTFFIQDECGNINSVNALFSIEGDTIPAQLISFPADTNLLCHQVLPTEFPVFDDNCDGPLALNYSESNNQSSNVDECGYYQYELLRQWNGADLCGNPVEYTQVINVVDTLSPTINFESIVAKNCDDDLSIIDDFIDYNDNCEVRSVSFVDTLLSSSKCIHQYDRTYTVVDMCSNIRNARQRIQVEDFSAPVFTRLPSNMTVACGTGNFETQFQNWVNNFASAIVADNCNSLKRIVKNKANLRDSIAIKNEPPATLNTIACTQSNPNDKIIFDQEFYFYAYDACGNVSSSAAHFIIIDTIPPVIPNCPNDRQIFLPQDECDIFSTISLPFAIDPCLNFEESKWDVSIDDVFIFEDSNESLDFSFDIGTHRIEYLLEDCGGNIASCQQTLMVIDSFPPKIECPDSIQYILPSNTCELNVDIPEIISFSDNCFGPADFSVTLPEGGGFINFEQKPGDTSYFSKSFNIEFQGINDDQRFFKPVLIIEYSLKIDIPSRIVLRSEFGDELFIAQKAPCVRQKQRLVIEENQFAVWSMDGNIGFALVIEENGGKGLIPCAPENLDGPSDIDDFSFFSITLEYTNINPDFTITDSASNIIGSNISSLVLESGNYDINYTAQDFAGNISTCVTHLAVSDTLNPTVTCSDKELLLTTDTDEVIDIILDDLNIQISDNCEIDRITYFPVDFTCQQINRVVPLVIQAWDVNDNFTFCVSNLSIKGANLKPSFIGGLCLADTLRLFSNVSQDINGEFSWTGPNNYKSTSRNPVIPNISLINSGRYTVNLITENGCPFTGFVDVEISQFASPTISSASLSVCEGDNVILNSNSYSELVNYFWYKGISPNGSLIEMTDGPSLEVSTELGIQNFYVEVEGQGCRSNPSNTLSIEVLEIPTAIISESFINICNGDNITLEALQFIPQYEYLWSGPDGYNSAGHLPEVIESASSINAGLYSLVVKNKNCFSQPAMVQVIVQNPPPKPIINGSPVFCEGERAVLEVTNGQAGYTYNWLFNGNAYISSSSNQLILSNIANTLQGEWQVIVEDNLCISTISEIFNLKVESIPQIGATGVGKVCEGDSIQLTASFIPNASYIWEDPEGNNYFSREIRPLAIDGNYTVTVTTANGCQTSVSTNVTVGLRPRVTALSNTSLDCMESGSSFQLNPTVFPPGNYTYIWSGPDNFNSDETNPIISDIDTSNLGTYALVVTNNNCSSLPGQTLVDYTITPERPIIIGDTVICEDENIILSLFNPSENQESSWVWFTPQGQITSSEPFIELPNFNNSLAGSYYVYEEINDCRSERSDIFNIDIINSIDNPEISGNNSICLGSELILQANGMAGESFNWILPNGDTLRSTQSRLRIESVELANSGIYQVFVEDDNCQSGLSQPFNVEVIENPSAPKFEISSIDLCPDNTDNLTICLVDEGIRFDSIQWINSQTNTIISSGPDFCLSLSQENIPNDQSYQIYVKAYLQSCSVFSDNTLTINLIQSTEDAYLLTDDIYTVCNSNFINLEADIIPENITASWTTVDPDIVIFNPNSASASFSNLKTGTNLIVLNSLTDDCPIFFSDTVQIVVLDEIVARDDQAQLEFNNLSPIDILSNDLYSGDLDIELINFPRFDKIEISNGKIIIENNDLVLGLFEIEYRICYTDCPDLCSTAFVYLQIGDNNQCIAGNLITPNNDGYNDYFNIPCLAQNAFPENQLTIFNQWGDEVFKASPYENNWEGTYRKEELPAGTYFYLLDLGDDSEPINGFIIIER